MQQKPGKNIISSNSFEFDTLVFSSCSVQKPQWSPWPNHKMALDLTKDYMNWAFLIFSAIVSNTNIVIQLSLLLWKPRLQLLNSTYVKRWTKNKYKSPMSNLRVTKTSGDHQHDEITTLFPINRLRQILFIFVLYDKTWMNKETQINYTNLDNFLFLKTH